MVGVWSPGNYGSVLSRAAATPIAANAKLDVATKESAGVHFTLAIGDGSTWLDSTQVRGQMMGDPSLVDAPIFGQLTIPRPLAGGPEDGIYAGHLVLEPSRSVALETKRLDRYFGGTLDFKVPVEIVTVPVLTWPPQVGP